ncbi:Hypothetical_protein [Hexamita inflata]|uniref:Hypothetical_protein n=1 Tax=Hexamita inflata TaxID=28002 RepID=A0AA86R1C4_9EUKA|nr:Hypothetical protein HINF_LOCUS52781 [Hexamita inflata]
MPISSSQKQLLRDIGNQFVQIQDTTFKQYLAIWIENYRNQTSKPNKMLIELKECINQITDNQSKQAGIKIYTAINQGFRESDWQSVVLIEQKQQSMIIFSPIKKTLFWECVNSDISLSCADKDLLSHINILLAKNANIQLQLLLISRLSKHDFDLGAFMKELSATFSKQTQSFSDKQILHQLLLKAQKQNQTIFIWLLLEFGGINAIKSIETKLKRVFTCSENELEPLEVEVVKQNLNNQQENIQVSSSAVQLPLVEQLLPDVSCVQSPTAFNEFQDVALQNESVVTHYVPDIWETYKSMQSNKDVEKRKRMQKLAEARQSLKQQTQHKHDLLNESIIVQEQLSPKKKTKLPKHEDQTTTPVETTLYPYKFSQHDLIRHRNMLSYSGQRKSDVCDQLQSRMRLLTYLNTQKELLNHYFDENKEQQQTQINNWVQISSFNAELIPWTNKLKNKLSQQREYLNYLQLIQFKTFIQLQRTNLKQCKRKYLLFKMMKVKQMKLISLKLNKGLLKNVRENTEIKEILDIWDLLCQDKLDLELIEPE